MLLCAMYHSKEWEALLDSVDHMDHLHANVSFLVWECCNIRYREGRVRPAGLFVSPVFLLLMT